MLDWPDWIWWTSASTFGVLAALGLYITLFRDRSRGRQRCPKCWYDMGGSDPSPLGGEDVESRASGARQVRGKEKSAADSNPSPQPSPSRREGAGRRCPECGYEGKHERTWLRTRRRWRWSVIGLALLAVALGSLGMPHYRRHGWAYYLPDRVLVWAYPRWDPPKTTRRTYLVSPIYDEIATRVWNDELSNGARRALVRALAPWLEDNVTPRHRQEALDLLADLHPESHVLLDRLIEIRASATTEPDTLALRVIAHYAWEDPRAERVVEDLLQDLDPQNDDVFWLAQGLPVEGPHLGRTVEILARLVEERSANGGNVAIQLALIGPDAHDALAPLRGANKEMDEQHGHEWSVFAAATAVITGEAESFIEYQSRLLSHDDQRVRLRSALLMMNYSGRGGFTAEAVVNLRRALGEETNDEVLNILAGLPGLSPKLARSLKSELRRNASDQTRSQRVQETAAWALDHIRYPNRRC